MSVTPVTARLLQTGYPPLDLTEYLSQETVPEITDAFEKPAETNAFVAPDVTVVGRDDAALTVTTRLRLLSPTGGDNTFEIWRGALRMFAGAIAPNTVSFDEQERSFTFTAFGLAKRLAEIDATPMFQRTNLDGWTVVSSTSTEIVVTKAAATTCPFMGGDTIAVVVPAASPTEEGSRDEVAVVQVMPLGSSEWSIAIPVSDLFPAGATVELVTTYIRGAAVRDVVTECFRTALGAGAAVNYMTSTPGEIGDFFATPLPTTGLTGTPFSVVTGPDRYHPIAVAQQGAYDLQSPPSGPWTFNTATLGQPAVGWIGNGGDGTLQLYGHLWDVAVSGPITARTVTYTYYAYRYDAPPPSCVRFAYSISTTLVSDIDGWYAVDVRLRQESSPDGKTWGSSSTPAGWADAGFVTSTFLRPYLNCGAKTAGALPKSIGIAYSTFAQALFAIEPFNAGIDGTPTRFRLIKIPLSTFTPATVEDDVRGALAMVDGATMIVFATDTLDDPFSGDVNAPHLSGYTTMIGSTTFFGAVAVPASVAWPSVGMRYVGSTQTLYMLGGSPKEGAYFLAISIPGTSAPTISTSMVVPPGPGIDPSALGLCENFDPLTVAPRWTALVGNTLWWVAATSSEVIDYLDCDGLTLADVVSQCALLTDAVWYVDVSSGGIECWYRSRQVASGFPVGADPALDDGGLLSLKSQPLWYRTYRYVSVTNERDETVHGAAGDGGYQSGTMGLSLTARYAYPSSYCAAIARHILAYLGRGLEFLDLMHEDDGRVYQIGRTFTLPARKPGKTFQVTEVQRPALAGTVRIQAVEL